MSLEWRIIIRSLTQSNELVDVNGSMLLCLLNTGIAHNEMRADKRVLIYSDVNVNTSLRSEIPPIPQQRIRSTHKTQASIAWNDVIETYTENSG